MSGRFGYSLFCDDIRNEVGGKLSFVGCYNGAMFIRGGLPVSLPKFCIHLHIKSPADRPFSSIIARCYVPGLASPLMEEMIEAPEPGEQVRLVSELEQESAPRLLVAAASLIISPLQIQEAGLIRVRALLDGTPEEMNLGSLRVVAI